MLFLMGGSKGILSTTCLQALVPNIAVSLIGRCVKDVLSNKRPLFRIGGEKESSKGR